MLNNVFLITEKNNCEKVDLEQLKYSTVYKCFEQGDIDKNGKIAVTRYFLKSFI